MRDNAERLNVKVRHLKSKMRRGGAHPSALRRRLRELRKRAP
jgi:hypothetical protein